MTSTDLFSRRHIGPSEAEVQAMLAELGYGSLDALTDAAVPEAIRYRPALRLPAARSEHEALRDLSAYAAANEVWRSYLGMGYHDCVTPPVILRNILENPGWYTQYTPYQPEISQGRLEALLNYQTLVTDLTALDIANASLLDEATAAAEAMTLLHRVTKTKRDRFVVDHECLRRQIEHELRGKHLRLRMMWWLHASRPADLRRALLMQTSGWNAVLRALLRLDGEAAPASHEATVDRVAERHGLSAAALHGALQLRTTRQRVSDAEAKQRYRDFLVEVERLVAIVDGLPA